MTQKAWAGRFDAPTDKKVERFTESISFDRRLWRHDIAGSVAHAQMLAEVGLISADEAKQIVAGLDEIGRELEAGTFEFRTDREDVHMHIESALIERLGDVGRKLHTGRSRNDQVATDLRLWTRDAINEIDRLLVELQRALIAAAERDRNVILLREWSKSEKLFQPTYSFSVAAYRGSGYSKTFATGVTPPSY